MEGARARGDESSRSELSSPGADIEVREVTNRSATRDEEPFPHEELELPLRAERGDLRVGDSGGGSAAKRRASSQMSGASWVSTSTDETADRRDRLPRYWRAPGEPTCWCTDPT